ncbi:MAG TPA: sugar phosphate nucleotidyltransferase [Candidatus Acidoferrales bacterium]|nr:sugar phosphate nucleotidyltransferase [Candidatus Acidoferrales bacterium]
MVAAGAQVTRSKLPACAVLLAGGRGTRFWPRSRMRTPKQLLNITGQDTMLRATLRRLQPLLGLKNFWTITNVQQAAAVRREMRGVAASHILAEPLGRNTAAAIGLAAIHLAHERGDAVIAVLPSDSYIAETARYRKLVRAAIQLAETPGSLVVMGIPPTRPETGYGYIERGRVCARSLGVSAYGVRRFTEKPALPLAKRYVASRRYFWNAGMFFWRVSTFLQALKQFLPATHDALMELKRFIGKSQYPAQLKRTYARLESISVDYAVMEPATRMKSGFRAAVIPASVGWSDIGSWAAVYELLAQKPGENVSGGPFHAIDARGNYFWSPKKFVAAIGVQDVVLVETDDALLLCSRERSQDVSKIVKQLEENRRRDLL